MKLLKSYLCNRTLTSSVDECESPSVQDGSLAFLFLVKKFDGVRQERNQLCRYILCGCFICTTTSLLCSHEMQNFDPSEGRTSCQNLHVVLPAQMCYTSRYEEIDNCFQMASATEHIPALGPRRLREEAAAVPRSGGTPRSASPSPSPRRSARPCRPRAPPNTNTNTVPTVCTPARRAHCCITTATRPAQPPPPGLVVPAVVVMSHGRLKDMTRRGTAAVAVEGGRRGGVGGRSSGPAGTTHRTAGPPASTTTITTTRPTGETLLRTVLIVTLLVMVRGSKNPTETITKVRLFFSFVTFLQRTKPGVHCSFVRFAQLCDHFSFRSAHNFLAIFTFPMILCFRMLIISLPLKKE